jgi:hypothetical protein
MDHVFVGAAEISRARTTSVEPRFASACAACLRVTLAKPLLFVRRLVPTRYRQRGAQAGRSLRAAQSELAERELSQMKIVIPGGTGQIGNILCRSFAAAGDEVVVLTRNPRPDSRCRFVLWDGKTLCDWTQEIEGADVVINLAGKSVNCRYGKKNRREIMDSRVDSVRAIHRAIEKAKRPPHVWLQAATATIYAHRFDAPNDELTGLIGGNEPNVPETWRFSIDVAKAWNQGRCRKREP